VRGLDYYRHTAFEFVTEDLGAQSQVIGGGRYDGLIESMGGPPTPAVGWASGIERMAMLIGPPLPSRLDAFLVPLGERAEAEAMRIAAELRRAGIACDMAWRGNMKRRMQKAAASGARVAIILGDDELAKGEAAVKNLESGEQVSVSIADLPRHIYESIGFDRLAVMADAVEPGASELVRKAVREGGRLGLISEPPGDRDEK
jgi:histidyl-tRNA synthetase